MQVYERMAVALSRVSDVEARVVATLLEGFSIRCMIKNPLPHSLYPLPFQEATLLVPESRLSEASELIESFLWHPRLVYSKDREQQ